MGFPGGSVLKNLPAIQEMPVPSLYVPWRRKWQFTLVFSPGKSHRQRNLEGYSLRGLQRVGFNDQKTTTCKYTDDIEGGYNT